MGGSFFFFNFIYLFIYFWLLLGLHCCTWAFLWLRRAGATLRCSVQASHCSGFSCGARALGVQASVVVAHGLSCSAACGIFPDQGSNPCPLHWQADSFFFFKRCVYNVNDISSITCCGFFFFFFFKESGCLRINS